LLAASITTSTILVAAMATATSTTSVAIAAAAVSTSVTTAISSTSESATISAVLWSAFLELSIVVVNTFEQTQAELFGPGDHGFIGRAVSPLA
jgi:hypothetical protein